METNKIYSIISSEAYNLVKENLSGCNYIRIFLYKDALNELLEKGETELEICGAHTFSNSQWNDIYQQNQIELCNFEQDNSIDEEVDIDIICEYFLKQISKEIDNNLDEVFENNIEKIAKQIETLEELNKLIGETTFVDYDNIDYDNKYYGIYYYSHDSVKEFTGYVMTFDNKIKEQ